MTSLVPRAKVGNSNRIEYAGELEKDSSLQVAFRVQEPPDPQTC